MNTFEAPLSPQKKLELGDLASAGHQIELHAPDLEKRRLEIERLKKAISDKEGHLVADAHSNPKQQERAAELRRLQNHLSIAQQNYETSLKILKNKKELYAAAKTRYEEEEK